MPRLSILNMAIGFLVLFFAAAAGSFVAFDLTEAFLRDKQLLDSWQAMLLRSSHGHTNLFAMIHILFGLTLPYSSFKPKWHSYQTAGLLAGTLAMGPGMIGRAYLGPRDSLDLVGILVGIGLSLALMSVASHGLALTYKLIRR